MMAPRHFAVSLFYFLGLRTARYPQEFIVVRALHRRLMRKRMMRDTLLG
jgi:hypothetical protein